jgi:hypothetical protein
MNANRPKRAYHRRAPEPAPPQSAPDVVLAVMDAAHEALEAPGPLPGAPRPEMRADPRPAMREESSRERAARRAAEIMGNLPDSEDADKFNVASLQPDDFTYEWKMRTVTGKEFPQQQIELAKYGWEAVPASRHPELMPRGWTGQTIEQEGLVLMERPKVITDKIKARDRANALAPIQNMKEKLAGVAPGQFARVDAHGNTNVKVAKAYTPVDIPGDAG